MIVIKNTEPPCNADRIRAMSIEQLNRFLFALKIEGAKRFMTTGGVDLMNASEQLEALKSTDWDALKGTEFDDSWLDEDEEEEP